MPDKRSTTSVGRALEKEQPGKTDCYVWERCSLKSEEAFRGDAIRILSDLSTLRGSTLQRADWADLYSRYTGVQPGEPVYHVDTGKLVGWLTESEFIPEGETDSPGG